MNREAEGLLLGGLAGGLIGGAVGGPVGAAVGLGLGAGTGLLIAEAAPGSYMYPGGVWNFSSPAEIKSLETGLVAFDKCLNDLNAKYAEWKAKFYKAWNDYATCLSNINMMMEDWKSKGRCLSACDLDKMRALFMEGQIRHALLKNLALMGFQVIAMQPKCCMHTAALQAMINFLDQNCSRACDLKMYEGDCSKVVLPPGPAIPSPQVVVPGGPTTSSSPSPQAPPAPPAPNTPRY